MGIRNYNILVFTSILAYPYTLFITVGIKC